MKYLYITLIGKTSHNASRATDDELLATLDVLRVTVYTSAGS